MDLFNRKKIKELQQQINMLKQDKLLLLGAIQTYKNDIDGLWCTVNTNAKFIYSIPQIKKCTSCANFKTDKKQFPICDLCSKNIFEVTTECQYTPR